MYTKLLRFILEFLKNNVNAADVQIGHYGDFTGIDFRQAAILLEPRQETGERNSNVWDRGEFHIRIWIMSVIERDYMASMEEMETIIGAEDKEQKVFGLKAALKLMRADSEFEALAGRMGGKRWRIGPQGLRIKGPTFGINVHNQGPRINTAQLDLFINLDVEH